MFGPLTWTLASGTLPTGLSLTPERYSGGHSYGQRDVYFHRASR